MVDVFKNDCFYFFSGSWRPVFFDDGIAKPIHLGASSGDFVRGYDLNAALSQIPVGLSVYNDVRAQVVEVADQFHSCLKWIWPTDPKVVEVRVPGWQFTLTEGSVPEEVPIVFRALLAVPIEHVPQFITDTVDNKATELMVKFMRGRLKVGI